MAGEYEVKEAKFYDIIKDGTVTVDMFKNISTAHIPQTGIQVRDTQNVPSNEGTATADTENVSPAVIPQTGTKRQVSGTVPSNVDGTPVIDIPQIGMQNGSIPSNEEASRRYAESIPSANIPKGMQAQLVRNAPSNEGTPAIVIPQTGMQNGSVPSAISVAQLLAGVKDRNGKPYINKDGGLNYESEALKGIKDTQILC